MTNKESANEISKVERYLINGIKSINKKALKTKLEKIEAKKMEGLFCKGEYLPILLGMLAFLGLVGLAIYDTITK